MDGSHVIIDDATLVRRIQLGGPDEELTAFEALVRQYSEKLLRSLSSKGLSSEECQDVASETWLRAWRGIARFEYRGISVFSWLIQIARNVSHELFRRRYLGVPLEDNVGEVDVSYREDDTAALVVGRLDRQEFSEAVRAVLQEAPEDFRLIIEAQFFAEFSTEEVMELFDWSRSKVYTTKHRALHWLRDRLMRRHEPTAVAAWRQGP